MADSAVGAASAAIVDPVPSVAVAADPPTSAPDSVGDAAGTTEADKVPLRGDNVDEDDEAFFETTKAMSKDNFFKRQQEIDDALASQRGNSPEDMHWSLIRRWVVRLSGIRVQDLCGSPEAKEQPFFLRFIFGGSQTEYKVSKDGQEKSPFSIWVMGDGGVEQRTPDMVYTTEAPYATSDMDCQFDWYGSYDDLRRGSLRIEAWNMHRWGPNKLDSWAQVPLIKIADGNVFNENTLVKLDKFGAGTPKRKCMYAAAFQEVYDFEMSIPACSAIGILRGEEALEKMKNMGDGAAREDLAVAMLSCQDDIQEDEEFEVCTKLNIYTPILNRRHLDSTRIIKSKAQPGRFPSWTPTGKVSVRGTVAEFNRAFLTVSIEGTVSDMSLFPGEARVKGLCGCFKQRFLDLFRVLIPLKNVLDTGDVQEPIGPIAWMHRVEGGRNAKKIDYGLFSGSVHVPNRPRYEQTTEDLQDQDFDYHTRRYLMVKVVKVDKVVTPPHDKRPVSEIDTFVEVTFDGIKKRTRTVQDQISPMFNDTLVWDMNLVMDGEFDDERTWEEIGDMGPLRFDFWTEGTVQREHLGHCKAFTSEILLDARGVPTKEHEERIRDEIVKVRKCVATRQLTFIWGTGPISNISFEIWFLRDLNPLARLSPIDNQETISSGFKLKFDKLLREWKQATKPYEVEGRTFPVTMRTQSQTAGHEQFIPRLIGSVRPPSGINDPEAVSRFIGCFPYREHPMEDRMVYTPEFFCAIRAGDVLDHTLLHASFLLGLVYDVYVCLGSLMDGTPHAWVATIDYEEGAVRFWEPFFGAAHSSGPNVYVMKGCVERAAQVTEDEASGLFRALTFGKNKTRDFVRRSLTRSATRAADAKAAAETPINGLWPVTTADGQQAVLPYRTVNIVFNNRNIWANVQSADPRRVRWDILNPSCWHAFAGRIDGLRPCFKGCHLAKNLKDEVELRQMATDLRRRIFAQIRAERKIHRMNSSFVMSPIMTRFLDCGLRLREKLHAAPEKLPSGGDDPTSEGGEAEANSIQTAPQLRKMLADWEEALQKKCPAGFSTSVCWLFFNVIDFDFVASQSAKLPERVHQGFSGMQLVAGTHVLPLPGGLFAIYVCIVEIHKKVLDADSSVSFRGDDLSTAEIAERMERLKLAQPDAQRKKAVNFGAQGDDEKGKSRPPVTDEDERKAQVKDEDKEKPPKKPPERAPREEPPERRPPEKLLEAPPPSTKVPKGSLAVIAPPSAPGVEYTFSKSVVGRQVSISDSGRRAVHQGAAGDLHGGVILEPALVRGERGWYFEVRVDEVRLESDLDEGMGIGVTTRAPRDVQDMPETPDLIDPSWLAGYCGWKWNGNNQMPSPGSWHPVELNAQDCVGALVTADGALLIFVNGKCVEQCDFNIPVDGQLFGVACLLGATSAITLASGARPPSNAEVAQVAPYLPIVSRPSTEVLSPMRGFSPLALGEHVMLSDDGLAARCVAEGEEIGGGVLGDGPLQPVPGGLYFELVIDKVTSGVDGMAVGVTTASPDQQPRVLPETLDLLRTSWLMGFDGATWDGATSTFADNKAFQPQFLKAGDHVGVFVELPAGTLVVIVNGKERIQGPSGIPADVPLFAAVDLIGCTRQVCLQPGAVLPELSEPQAGAFHPTLKGSHIKLSSSRGSAQRSEKAALDGLTVIGEAPLSDVAGGGCSFELRIDAVDPRSEASGFSIGVTSRAPTSLKRMPPLADEIAPCWLAGFDGALWDGGRREWQLCDWKPSGLAVGDTVGISISPSGNMRVSVNGRVRANGCTGVAALPLFPVVDLLPPISGVTLLAVSRSNRGSMDTDTSSANSLGGIHFHPRARGDSVSLDHDGLAARRKGDKGAVLLSSQLEPSGDGGTHFDLTVTSVKSGYPDGLAIGVTTRPPPSIPKGAVPPTADGVEPSWLVGFDGAAWDGPTKRWSLSNWDPRDLRPGDRLKVRVSQRGRLSVQVNGSTVAKHPGHVPVTQGLFALVDLVGSTTGVTLEPSSARSEVPMDQYLRDALDDDFGVGTNHIPVGVTGNGTSALALGFSRSRHGKYVVLSEDGRRASRDPRAGGARGGGGTLLGKEALPLQSNGGVQFSVCIDQVRSRGQETAGLFAIGVTAEDPSSLKEMPDVVDDLPHCWAVGFNGASLVTHRRQKDNVWGVFDWDASTLRPGDKVQVNVDGSSSRQAQVNVMVNGNRCGACTMHIPLSRPLFPLVDLDGPVLALSVPSNSRDGDHEREGSLKRHKRKMHRDRRQDGGSSATESWNPGAPHKADDGPSPMKLGKKQKEL